MNMRSKMKSSAVPTASRWAVPSALHQVRLNRRVLLGLSALAIVAAAALNWSWLIAAGLAPLLLSVLPCAAMCALGLCMKGAGQSCESEAAAGSGMDKEKVG